MSLNSNLVSFIPKNLENPPSIFAQEYQTNKSTATWGQGVDNAKQVLSQISNENILNVLKLYPEIDPSESDLSLKELYPYVFIDPKQKHYFKNQ